MQSSLLQKGKSIHIVKIDLDSFFFAFTLFHGAKAPFRLHLWTFRAVASFWREELRTAVAVYMFTLVHSSDLL